MWIVKDISGYDYPYMCAEGPGSCWGPDQIDAKRFKTKLAALRAMSKTYPELPGRKLRVFKLVNKRERIIDLARDLLNNWDSWGSPERLEKLEKALKDYDNVE